MLLVGAISAVFIDHGPPPQEFSN